MGTQLHLTIL